MEHYVIAFAEIDRRQGGAVGGKDANLEELSRMEDVRVTTGFCVTTDAFRQVMTEAPSIHDRLDAPSCLTPGDREAIFVARSLEEVEL
jgi:pyruvate,water dikinase